MKLSETTLQKLKILKDLNFNAIEDLDPQYVLYREFDSQNKESYYTLQTENIIKLLTENICDLKQLVDKFATIKHDEPRSCLSILFRNEELFEELINRKLLSAENLRYLMNSYSITTNTPLSQYTINNNLLTKFIVDNCMFTELVDKCKSERSMSSMYKVDSYLSELLWNEKLFEELIETDKLTRDDLRYLLNKITLPGELNYLCVNTSLIKHVLNEFILDKEDVDKFNEIIENDHWRKKEGVHTIFEFIRHLTVYTQVDYDVFEEKDENDVDHELLKLKDLNEKVYKLNFKFEDNQRNELGQTLTNNEIALNRLTEIVENNLETNYNFESLMQYLKKNEKKNLLNI